MILTNTFILNNIYARIILFFIQVTVHIIQKKTLFFIHKYKSIIRMLLFFIHYFDLFFAGPRVAATSALPFGRRCVVAVYVCSSV